MGGLFSVYRNPTDARWQGPQKWGPRMMLPITLFFIIDWIFFISDQAYSATLWNQWIQERQAKIDDHQPSWTYDGYEPPVVWTSGARYSPPNGIQNLFLRAGLALIPELIHIPLHFYLYQKNRMHPIAALTLSIVALSFWMSSAWMNMISPFGSGVVYSYETWFSLIITEFTIHHIIVILYLIYMGFAAHAVRLYNRGKKDERAFERGIAKGVELAKMDKDVRSKDVQAYERGVMKGLELAQGDAEVEYMEYKKSGWEDLPALVRAREDGGKDLPSYEEV